MDYRNLIMSMVVAMVILFGWQLLFPPPPPPVEAEAQATSQAANTSSVPGLVGEATDAPITRSDALGASPRVIINSDKLSGSINLKGARLDDLTLTGYRISLEDEAENIHLLLPVGTERPYYFEPGWNVRGSSAPNKNSLWTVVEGSVLTPDSPVSLAWVNEDGVTFMLNFSMDDQYLFTVKQKVINAANKDISLRPYGLLTRTGMPEIQDFFILHEGMIAVADDTLVEIDYSDLLEDRTISYPDNLGWVGISDKYWITALRLSATDTQNSNTQDLGFRSGQRGDLPTFQSDSIAKTTTIPANGAYESTIYTILGAKEIKALDQYRDENQFAMLDRAVDFGWFYFLTKPMYFALSWFANLLGNFGLALLALTVCVKLVLFPLANKSYRSMSRMKLLQPKMLELRERFANDKVALNKSIMELYKKEKVNPLAGCLPVLVQIPVFFALYKVLFVTIEMRHAPFYGWIHDLSAPDPLRIFNGFGLFTWDVPPILEIVNLGIWPIIMGITMRLQMRLNPPPPDPIQKKIFAMMPIMFTFFLAAFPAGLVIYWSWNNTLSIIQQSIIMKRTAKDMENSKS